MHENCKGGGAASRRRPRERGEEKRREEESREEKRWEEKGRGGQRGEEAKLNYKARMQLLDEKTYIKASAQLLHEAPTIKQRQDYETKPTYKTQ